MKTWKKVAAVGGVLGLIWYFNKKKVADNLDITLEDLDGIDLTPTAISGTVTVALHNPTNGQLRVKYPYLRFTIDGKFLGNSTIKDELINIQPNSTQKVSIQLNISNASTVLALPTIIQNITNGKKMDLVIGIRTGLEFTDLPEQKEIIPLSF